LFRCPQAAHLAPPTGSDATVGRGNLPPQPLQNLASSRFSAPQEGHSLAILPPSMNNSDDCVVSATNASADVDKLCRLR
jgi:hypothetical protein